MVKSILHITDAAGAVMGIVNFLLITFFALMTDIITILHYHLRSWTYDLRSSGQRVGCTFSSWKTWPNTLLAHCLVSAVDEKDSAKAEETYLRLLKLSYEEGENISDSATLSRVAAEAGLAGDEWRSEKWKRCVLEEDQRAKQEMDIHGVPRWFVSSTQKPGQRVELDGAVSVDRFLRALNQFRSN